MMRITEKRLRSIVRNVLAEAMFGLYKRNKKDKGFKWGKWNRDVGGGGDFANYYDDDYGDGFYEGDDLEEIDEVEELDESCPPTEPPPPVEEGEDPEEGEEY